MENLKGTLQSLYGKETADGSGLKNNKVANFAYTSTAYDNDIAQGVESYSEGNEQNIPVNTPTVLDVNSTVLAKGYRSQASSITRMLVNHIFGRVSYNLNKIHDWFATLLSQLELYIAGSINAWSNSVTYSAGEYCFMYATAGANNTSYVQIFKCIADDNLNHSPVATGWADWWVLVQVKDVDTSKNIKLFVSGEAYALGEMVYMITASGEFVVYKCLTANTTELPSTTATNWQLQSVAYATNATALVNGSRVALAVGNSTAPVYFANGVPVKCDVPSITVPFGKERFMTFDFTDDSHKSIKIKKGIRIRLDIVSGDTTEHRIFEPSANTIFNFATQMQAVADVATVRQGQINGRDFFVYIVPEGTSATKLVVSLNSTYPNDVDATYTANNTRKIGQFHTLCANANYVQGTMLTAISPVSKGVSAGAYVPLKNYSADDEDGFYDFYCKEVRSVSTTPSYENNATFEHPLNNFLAGGILPESVWCLTFSPVGCDPSGMVFDKDTSLAVDVYLQSGCLETTTSEYGATITDSMPQIIHRDSMTAVGKRLLFDGEFTRISIGSNQATSIYGSVDPVATGGHRDTASVRMLAFNGCEDCCGALVQWLAEVAPAGGSAWAGTDGNGAFGQYYGNPYGLHAGGIWNNPSSCGSRCRACDVIVSYVGGDFSARGASPVGRLGGVA